MPYLASFHIVALLDEAQYSESLHGAIDPLMRYVLFFCLKPLLLTSAWCDGVVGAGAGTNTGVGAFLLCWRIAGSSHTSGRRINDEP